MPEYLTQSEAFLKCKKEGKYHSIEEIDIAKIKSILMIAQADVDSANALIKITTKHSIQWSSIYKLYYDALHELSEAFLCFERIKIDNHQCLFAYLCVKYDELELNWEFLEKVRTKRNGINYYGTLIHFPDWKEVEIQFNLYINKMKEEIGKKLEEH